MTMGGVCVCVCARARLMRLSFDRRAQHNDDDYMAGVRASVVEAHHVARMWPIDGALWDDTQLAIIDQADR